jgi:acyl carrier protein
MRIAIDTGDALALVFEETSRILREKGAAVPALDSATAFLGGAMDFDSLDLATLIVALEERTGFDPFRAGFREFTTIGELASLYAAP